jgi:hypothetical protein
VEYAGSTNAEPALPRCCYNVNFDVTFLLQVASEGVVNSLAGVLKATTEDGLTRVLYPHCSCKGGTLRCHSS